MGDRRRAGRTGLRRARQRARQRARRRRVLAGALATLTLLAAGALWGAATNQDSSTRTRSNNADVSAKASEPAPPERALPTGGEAIRTENAKPGTGDWVIEYDQATFDKIAGFADHVSVQQGDTFSLRVSTQAPSYTARAFRMGYYGGDGGRLIETTPQTPGIAQPSCPVLEPTKTVDCSGWTPQLDFNVDDRWPPGAYLIKLESSDGGASYVPITVRDDVSHAAIVLISAITTWQAYNTWGGYSIYHGPDGASRTRAPIVSFDRPYANGGSAHFFEGEYELVQQVESMGLDVTYTTNIDEHQRPELLLNHKAVFSLAHDEYYSLEMRNGLEAARDHGVNLAFLGANAVYRRIRLEPSPLGPDRHEVNYRVASQDPLNGKDPERVTTSWRQAPAARPESSLIGGYYECNPVKADMVIVAPDAWMFAGSGVTAGQHLPDLVQNEYDRVTPGVPTPPNIQILAHSPLECGGRSSYADMTYYTAPSGAGVFATGTLWWERHLGSLCPPQDNTPANVDCQIRQITANILKVFAAGPAGRKHPSVSNVAEFGIHLS